MVILSHNGFFLYQLLYSVESMTNLFRNQMERHFAASRPFAALKAALGHGNGSLQVTGPKGAYLALVLDSLQGRATGPSPRRDPLGAGGGGDRPGHRLLRLGPRGALSLVGDGAL